jgi:hypothetical protein
MRTTVTIDPDVALLLKEEMERSKVPFKQALNGAIRRGLTDGTSQPRTKFVTKGHHFGFYPGTDLNRISQFADDLEDEEIMQKVMQGR